MRFLFGLLFLVTGSLLAADVKNNEIPQDYLIRVSEVSQSDIEKAYTILNTHLNKKDEWYMLYGAHLSNPRKAHAFLMDLKTTLNNQNHQDVLRACNTMLKIFAAP